MAYIYIYDINKEIFDQELMESSLPSNVVDHIKNYQDKNTFKLSFIGWYNLVKILNNKFNLDLKGGMILYNKNNKPYIKDSPIYISLSHSNNLVVIAISTKEIGIDIEQDRSVKRFEHLKQFIDDVEIKTTSELIRAWTIYEAKIKSVGSSIYNKESIKNVSFSLIDTKQIKDSYNNNYYLTICEK